MPLRRLQKNNQPFVLNMATTTVAIGKLAIARREGKAIPEGWVLDENGQPTTDSTAAHISRLLTPLGGDREHGGHKGYGLVAMVDILSSTLSGAMIASIATHFEQDKEEFNIEHFMLAIDPVSVLGDDSFESSLDVLIDTSHATLPVDKQQSVLVTGDPKHKAYEQRCRSGIPVPEKLVEWIWDVVDASNIKFILV